MMVVTKAQVQFETGAIEIEIMQNATGRETFSTSLQELEAMIVDLSKIRLMAIIQQEKIIQLKEPVAEEFVIQNKRIRNILVNKEDVALVEK